MSDLAFARAAAASYDPAPAGTVVDWRDCRMVVKDGVAAIRGTVPDNWENWLRDFNVRGELARAHPTLGLCPTGAMDAAEALAPSVPVDVHTITGHSLGGQVGVLIAGLLVSAGRTVRLVTWDAPKAGGGRLELLLEHTEIRQYRFRGSYVTDWPAFLDRHVSELIDMGAWTEWAIEAHSVARAVAWLAAREPAPA